MTHAVLIGLILAIAVPGPSLAAQDTTDLRVQLRSVTGSNQFRIGEMIPLEVVLSSETPNRYLEPCVLFRESYFGFPRCRFFSRWSFAIVPDDGWVDLSKEFPSGPMSGGGPSFKVPDRYLSTQPQVFPYMLTHRFRFDKPGEYHVQLSLDVGFDDESTQSKSGTDTTVKPHLITVTPEIVLEIVPATLEWQKEVVRKGLDAYSGPMPRLANPPSQEMLQYQEATEALCNLGTPAAARGLVGLLSSERQDIEPCLDRTLSADAAITEMERLLVDPNIGVNASLFSELIKLVGVAVFKSGGTYVITQSAVDREREILLSALPRKRGAAQVTSLVTALQHPSPGNEPFNPSVIAATVANYDNFPSKSQEWLLESGWGGVRSPLMLPLVRRLADAGNGQALLRWMELDPTTAADFIRKEVVRPVPRFSSFYLRLADALSPEQEQQLAANFVALTRNEDLLRAATLLHSYATKAVLPIVLPFIDAHCGSWPTSVHFAVLAYLLKVSPEDATPRVEQLLEKLNHDPRQPTFFTVIGFLEASPILERLAMTQIETGTQPLTNDATDYLRMYGSAAAKPFVWKELLRRHERLVALQAADVTAKRATAGQMTPEYLQNILMSAIIRTFVNAQGWVVTSEDSDRLEALLGKQAVAQLSCTFRCGSPLGVTPGPATSDYAIYSHANGGLLQDQPEYMRPTERLYYSINQYRCADMQALKAKILQFPVYSFFSFTYDFSAADRDELVEISDFLWNHGYRVRNIYNWSFLRPDSR